MAIYLMAVGVNAGRCGSANARREVASWEDPNDIQGDTHVKMKKLRTGVETTRQRFSLCVLAVK